MNFTVEFYYTSDGNSPIEEFLSSLDIKILAKQYRKDFLEREGN